MFFHVVACDKDCGQNGFCNMEGKCECKPDWSGDHCEMLTCDARCQEHGQCKNGTCICSLGWNGKHCTLGKGNIKNIYYRISISHFLIQSSVFWKKEIFKYGNKKEMNSLNFLKRNQSIPLVSAIKWREPYCEIVFYARRAPINFSVLLRFSWWILSWRRHKKGQYIFLL